MFNFLGIAVRVYPKNNGVRKALKTSHRPFLTKEIPSGDSSPKSDSYLSEDSKAKTFASAPMPISSSLVESKETDNSDEGNNEDMYSVSSQEQAPNKANDEVGINTFLFYVFSSESFKSRIEPKCLKFKIQIVGEV